MVLNNNEYINRLTRAKDGEHCIIVVAWKVLALEHSRIQCMKACCYTHRDLHSLFFLPPLTDVLYVCISWDNGFIMQLIWYQVDLPVQDGVPGRRAHRQRKVSSPHRSSRSSSRSVTSCKHSFWGHNILWSKLSSSNWGERIQVRIPAVNTHPATGFIHMPNLVACYGCSWVHSYTKSGRVSLICCPYKLC